ncbi:MAG: hypothetical protein HY070_05365 [Chloroflexi bacterium]|nr:hypothetical protein [Chloroflexota bacterium]
MTFQEAESKYKELAAQHASGKLSDADFETQVNDLRLQDSQGRWWQIGVQSGDWYVNDGQKWAKAKPPLDAPVTQEVAPATEGATAAPGARPSMPLRQIFSSKPAGRANGGLPMPVLVGIIVVVALVGAGVIFGGYLLLSGQINLGGTTTARATATQIAVLPTSALPPLAPIATATSVLAQPTATTSAITATLAITPTNTRPPAPTRTPTKPPAPAAPSNTPTLSAPPGIYVTNIVPDPAVPNFNEFIAFRVDFFNNTGGPRQLTWLVKIYQAPPLSDLTRSFSETKRASTEIRANQSELVTERSWKTGPGTCEFVAEVFYLDSENTGQLLPLGKPDGKRGIFNFRMAC